MLKRIVAVIIISIFGALGIVNLPEAVVDGITKMIVPAAYASAMIQSDMLLYHPCFGKPVKTVGEGFSPSYEYFYSYQTTAISACRRGFKWPRTILVDGVA